MVKDGLRVAKRETKVLGHQNFGLCDVIADTRALQAYYDYLDNERYLLNGGGLVPREVAQNELDDEYDDEIRRLEELLEACEERERSIQFELAQAQESLDDQEKQYAEAHSQVNELEGQKQKAEEDARQALLDYNQLDKDVEELNSTYEFRRRVCEDELENVRDYVENWNEDSEDRAFSPMMDKNGKYNATKDYNDNAALNKMLEDFANNYQNLLNDAFVLEKEQIEAETDALHRRSDDLQHGINNRRDQKERIQEDMKQLKEEKAQCEREYGQIATQRANDRASWEKERTDMEKQIEKIGEEIKKKEEELARLVALDNELVRQSCELELEIQGYKTMMSNEEILEFE